MKGKFTWLLLSCLMVLVLILTACGTKTTQTTTPTTTTTSPPVTTTIPSPTVQPSTSPTIGGTLRIVMGNSPVSFGDPAEGGGPEDWYDRTVCLENLTYYDEKGMPQPLLAESFVEDPAAKTVIFKLRPGVKFHDGTAFDATACKWNFEHLMAGQGTSWAYPTVESFDVLDDLTVRVNMKSWDSTFVFNMYQGSPMISPTTYEANGKDWAISNPVGTGPFKMTEFQRDVKIVFEKFDDYWQKGKPYLDKVIINLIADPSVQMASFLREENDIIQSLNPYDAKSLEGNQNVVVSKALLDGADQVLNPDGANPDSPYYDIRVRQAVAYAIDRDTIVKSIFYGYAYPFYQYGAPNNWSTNKDMVGYPYNPDKARQLLEAAGYPDGFDTVIYTRPAKLYVDLMTAVQSYLADVGIRAKLEIVEVGLYTAMTFGTGWPTNGLLAGDSPYNPELGSTMFFVFMHDIGMPLSKLMVTSEQNDAIGALFYQYLGAGDFTTHKSFMWDLQSLIFDKECISPVICASIALAAKSKKVHDEYTCYISQYPWTFADAWIEK
jgi:peptide/nickel transport system substrate-binding protein